MNCKFTNFYPNILIVIDKNNILYSLDIIYLNLIDYDLTKIQILN